jgi:hypothetical protein
MKGGDDELAEGDPRNTVALASHSGRSIDGGVVEADAVGSNNLIL